MSERERSRQGPIPEGEERPNPGGDPKQFLRLVSEATAASGDDKLERVGELIDTLVAMRAPGNERAEAKAVLATLDLKSLTGWVDKQGRSARQEAVETVMSLGFPYALAVTPEDFAFARAQGETLQAVPKLDAARRAAVGFGFTAAAFQLAGLLAHGFSERADEAVLMAGTTLTTALWALWLNARKGTPQPDGAPGGAGLVVAVGALAALWGPLPLLGYVPAALMAVASTVLLATSSRVRGPPPDAPG